MLGRILLAVLFAASAGVVWYALSPDGRHFIDRATINLDRAKYQAHFRAGNPLPGTPDLSRFAARMNEAGVQLGMPIHLRVYKLESEIEVWVKKGRTFERFATYPICMWSGRLGPKLQEGDRQAPEGFYTVSKEALNPNSIEHLSFNLGFPNVYDRSKGRTGSFLMVHGGCASIGCYAVTDGVVDELWAFMTAAYEGGQQRVPVHAFPFRMTERNMWLRKGHAWSGFWANLKNGHDLFEETRVPPKVSVCGGAYVFEPGNDASLTSEVEAQCPGEVAENS